MNCRDRTTQVLCYTLQVQLLAVLRTFIKAPKMKVLAKNLHLCQLKSVCFIFNMIVKRNIDNQVSKRVDRQIDRTPNIELNIKLFKGHFGMKKTYCTVHMCA